MPSFSKDVALLLFLVMTSSILTFTTTIVVASSAATVGSTNDLRPLVRKIKNSKKQGIQSIGKSCTLPDICVPAGGTFKGVSTFPILREMYAFETCYQLDGYKAYCWTKSYRDDIPTSVDFKQCVPDGNGWHAIHAYYVNPVTQPNTCGDPCQNQHQIQCSDKQARS